MAEYKKKPFSISVLLGDHKFSSSGENALEALTDLPKPDKIMHKAIVTVSKGKESHDLLYMPVKLKRLYWKNARPTLAKQFENLFA